MTKVLLAGGAGYIGCVLVPELLKRNFEVRVLDKLTFGAQGLEPVKDQIELVVGDVQYVTPSVLDGVDAIINLAGLSNDPTAEYNPTANKLMNTDAVLALARLARDHGIKRFVQASSCSIYYSMTPDNDLRTEDYPVNPTAPYSRSKRDAEIGLIEMAGKDFCPVMLRKGTVFGMSPRMRFDLVVNTFTKDAFKNRVVNIHAGGRMWRPMLHVNDACDAYIAAVTADEDSVRGKIINVLSDNYTVLKLAQEVRRSLEHNCGIRLDLNVQQVGLSRSYRVDGSRCEKLLGVNPHRGINSAVEEIWNAIELMDDDIDNPIFYNIRWLEHLVQMEKHLRVMDYDIFGLKAA